MMADDKNKLLCDINNQKGIYKLLAIMQSLRAPDGGCPWDLKQNYQSILPYTIEEVYEVAEAIESGDFDSLKEELGDLLFQVVFYAQLGKEDGLFDFDRIVENINEKLISRHPHVFSSQNDLSDSEIKNAWEELKVEERKSKGKSGTLDDIPKALPELKRAQKIQKRVAKIGFDWEHVNQVWDKIFEECDEVKTAETDAQQEEELGDLLFAVVNLTRHYGFDAEIALRKANQKFSNRFNKLESKAEKQLHEYSLEELEVMWQGVKRS